MSSINHYNQILFVCNPPNRKDILAKRFKIRGYVVTSQNSLQKVLLDENLRFKYIVILVELDWFIKSNSYINKPLDGGYMLLDYILTNNFNSIQL